MEILMEIFAIVSLNRTYISQASINFFKYSKCIKLRQFLRSKSKKIFKSRSRVDTRAA